VPCAYRRYPARQNNRLCLPRAVLCGTGNPHLAGVCPRTLSFHQITKLTRLVACFSATPLPWNSMRASTAASMLSSSVAKRSRGANPGLPRSSCCKNSSPPAIPTACGQLAGERFQHKFVSMSKDVDCLAWGKIHHREQ